MTELVPAQEQVLDIKDRIFYSMRKSFSGVRYQFSTELENLYAPALFTSLPVPYVYAGLFVRSGQQ